MKDNYSTIVSFFFISLFIGSKAQFIQIPFGNYYNTIKVNDFLHISNGTPTNDLDLHYTYYPNVCSVSSIYSNSSICLDSSTLTNPKSICDTKNVNSGSGSYDQSLFGWNQQDQIPPGSIIFIKNGTSVTSNIVNRIPSDLFDFICVEGSLTISGASLSVGGIIILEGGSITLINSSLSHFPLISSFVDPFSYFPGVLNLGGSFIFDGGYGQKPIQATKIGKNSLRLSSEIQNEANSILYIFSSSYSNGLMFKSGFSISNNTLNYTGADIPSEDKLIVVFIYKYSLLSKIFNTGSSKVSIKNTLINIQSMTSNDKYNDTTLEISPNDPSIATKVNLGNNQRFRGALHLQFVQDAVIDGCLFTSLDNGRAPITVFASSLNISNSIISSKSGSNIIAQYGTEFINSQNNYYYLQQADTSPQQAPPASNMDYGYEGNGIYSLSPNIISTNDTFIGQKNAFNFNFIANRSSITGFDYDCYLPCTSTSTLVSSSIQYPTEFKINNPTFIQDSSTPSSKQYLIRINNNGNQPSRTFTIKDLQLSTSTSIYANLTDSTLLLNNINSLEDFSIDGSITKLSIINSIFKSSHNNNATILSTSIQNTLFNSKLKDINIPINQNYGSISTPYLYSSLETLNSITINSIYPSIPTQMNVDTPLEIKVIFTSSIDITSFQCILGNSINGEIYETFGSYTSLEESQCQFEFKPTNQGEYNLVVIVRADENDYCMIVHPKVVVFPRYRFYSGLFFSVSNSALQVKLEDNTFISGCIKPYCTFIQESNLKYSTLPNTELDASSPYHDIVKYGVTTNDESKPLEIQFVISPSSPDYQIQLLFVYYQAIDGYGSPLSISLNDEPIFVLETIYQESTLNNVTFYYNNSQRSSIANLKIHNRGDIYLTSIIVYSNVEPLIQPPPPKDYKYLIKILVPILIIAIIVAIIFIIVYKRYRWPNRKYFSLLKYRLFGVRSQASFPQDYNEYQLHSSIYELLQDSKFYAPSSKSFPIKISTYKLDFGLNGAPCKVGVMFHDQVTVTNVSQEQVRCLLILPPQNQAFDCSADYIGALEPGESKVITFSIKVACTIRFLEKVAIFVEGYGHIFICLHLESSLSNVLDISEFEFVSILGEGTFGVVFEALWRGQSTAVKIIKQSQPKLNRREINILSDVRHPNIVSYFGTISNFHCLCLVTEYAKYGSLQTVLYDTPGLKLSTIQKVNIAINIAKGCSFLHQNGVIHRDLKPGNVLIVNIADSGDCAKVSDFGSSRYLSFEDVALTKNVGTPMYMGNEVLTHQGYDSSADVYSFGILLYELMTEIKPFSNPTGLKGFTIPQFVARGGRPKEGLENVHPDLHLIMQACWDYRPRKRPTFRNVVMLLTEVYDTLVSDREHLLDKAKEKESAKGNGIEMDSIQDDKFLKIQVEENQLDNSPKPKRIRLRQLPEAPADQKKLFIISSKYQNLNHNAQYNIGSKEKFRVSLKFERSVQNRGRVFIKLEEFESIVKCAFMDGAHKFNCLKRFTTDLNLLRDINPTIDNKSSAPSDDSVLQFNKEITLNLDEFIRCINIPDGSRINNNLIIPTSNSNINFKNNNNINNNNNNNINNNNNKITQFNNNKITKLSNFINNKSNSSDSSHSSESDINNGKDSNSINNLVDFKLYIKKNEDSSSHIIDINYINYDNYSRSNYTDSGNILENNTNDNV